jgi:glucose-6-phosphate isomerase
MLKILDSTHSTSAELKTKALAALQNFMAEQKDGFLSLPERQDLLQASMELGQSWRQKIDDLVIIGIGGSSLGVRALTEVFEKPLSDKKVLFCDSTDPIAFEETWQRCRDLRRTGWLLISKSGSTVEPLALAELMLEKYEQLKLTPTVAVISEKRSNVLTDWAKTQSIPVLEIPVGVGGRYSILTPVGLVPVAFLGANASQLLQGAAQARQALPLAADLIAQSLQSFDRQEWISLFWFYSANAQSLGAWLQQLWAESLAKTVTTKGVPAPRVSTPMIAIGPRDQHSILQQVMDGARDKFVVFVRFHSLESKGDQLKAPRFRGQEFLQGHSLGHLIAAQAQGTEQALRSRGVSTLALSMEAHDEGCLGYFFMLWEMVVAGLARSLDINAFDQPSVELGKRLAKEILNS